jgi:hypothetical protein
MEGEGIVEASISQNVAWGHWRSQESFLEFVRSKYFHNSTKVLLVFTLILSQSIVFFRHCMMCDKTTKLNTEADTRI